MLIKTTIRIASKKTRNLKNNSRSEKLNELQITRKVGIEMNRIAKLAIAFRSRGLSVVDMRKY